MATQTVLAISSDAEFGTKISSIPASTLVVLYFHAPWAAPCKQMSVVLDALASTYPADAPVTFLSIPAEDLPETSEQYDVSAVPFVVLQRGGSVLEPISGSDAAKVRAAVEKHVGAGSNAAAASALPPAQNVTKPAVPSEAGTNGAAPAPERDLVGGKGEPLAPELHTRLDGLVKAAPVMLFMKGTPSAPQCGFSRKTVGLLRDKQVRYGFFNILADQDVREGLKKYADWPTYPQLWVDGDLVGGLDIITEEFENDPEFLDRYSVSAKKDSATVEAGA